MEDEMPERTGREPAINLTEEDWAAVQAITAEILAGMDCVNTVKFERYIQAVLARNFMEALEKYDAQLTEEETHKWEFGEHHISQCQIDWCGRYRGQRRDSQPPAIPGTPTGYCGACARSGVGACDDFPNCPGGRGGAQ
jgi:hypothetical protein